MESSNQSLVEQTFRTNEVVLIRWLTATLGDSDTARDVAQTTFVKIWTYAQRHTISSPKTLIFKMASYLAIDEIRRRKRNRRRNISTNDLISTERMIEISTTDPTPEECTSLKQQAELTLRAIASLPPNPRAAFRMHRFEGLKYCEIAERMNVSKSSVEKYMIDALKQIRSAV